MGHGEPEGRGCAYLCPLISATSVMPPTLKRKYSRFRARAMERAMLVLPTPGGPWKQRILPWVEPRSWLTAMNSCRESGSGEAPVILCTARGWLPGTRHIKKPS